MSPPYDGKAFRSNRGAQADAARICMLLTSQPWWDQRHFHKQVPALTRGGYEVVFMADGPGRRAPEGFKVVVLSPRERRRARLTGGLNLFGRILHLRPAILQLCSFEQLPLGLALKLLTGVGVVYDCREDMASAMLQHKERIPRPLRRVAHYAARLLEYLSARFFDGLIVSDPALYRIHYAAPPGRKTVFLNTPLPSQFRRDYPPLAQRKYDVVLMGSMSPRTGVISLIEAVGLLKQRGLCATVLLLGQPSDSVIGTIKRRAEELGVADQVTITGSMTYDKVPPVLQQAKIGVVTLPDMAKFRHNIACKAFEYMACGMPCICTDLPPQRIFIRHGRNGLLYPPDDTRALANALATLLNDLPRAQAMGDGGRSDFEAYWNAERDQRELQGFYRRILAGDRLPANNSFLRATRV